MMFTDLSVFEKQRNGIEAVGFYLFYLVTIIAIAALLGLLLARDFTAGATIGRIVAIILCLGLSFLVVIKKGRYRCAGSVVIALLSGVGAYFLGGFLGLAATASDNPGTRALGNP